MLATNSTVIPAPAGIQGTRHCSKNATADIGAVRTAAGALRDLRVPWIPAGAGCGFSDSDAPPCLFQMLATNSTVIPAPAGIQGTRHCSKSATAAIGAVRTAAAALPDLRVPWIPAGAGMTAGVG